MTNYFFDEKNFPPLEEIAIEAAVAERKALAGQIKDPTERMVVFASIILHEHWLRQQFNSTRNKASNQQNLSKRL